MSTKKFENNPKQFGARLKSVRDQLGLAQEAVNQRLGWSKHYLNRIENGHTWPSVRLVMQLADVYGMSIDQLVGWDYKEPVNTPKDLAEILEDLARILRKDERGTVVNALKGGIKLWATPWKDDKEVAEIIERFSRNIYSKTS